MQRTVSKIVHGPSKGLLVWSVGFQRLGNATGDLFVIATYMNVDYGH
jgi:hypothetical protein